MVGSSRRREQAGRELHRGLDSPSWEENGTCGRDHQWGKRHGRWEIRGVGESRRARDKVTSAIRDDHAESHLWEAVEARQGPEGPARPGRKVIA